MTVEEIKERLRKGRHIRVTINGKSYDVIESTYSFDTYPLQFVSLITKGVCSYLRPEFIKDCVEVPNEKKQLTEAVNNNL